MKIYSLVVIAFLLFTAAGCSTRALDADPQDRILPHQAIRPSRSAPVEVSTYRHDSWKNKGVWRRRYYSRRYYKRITSRVRRPAVVKRFPVSLPASVAAPDILHYLKMMELLSGRPFTGGNKVTLLRNDQETYAAIFEAIGNARDHINLETFVIKNDKVGRLFVDALLKKRSEGVGINIIYDSIGSRKTPEELIARMRALDIRMLGVSPAVAVDIRNFIPMGRNEQRKIIVIDGTLAFALGLDIGETYCDPVSFLAGSVGSQPERETSMRIEGPIVAEFQKLFLDKWFHNKGSALRPGQYYPPLRDEGNALVRLVTDTGARQKTPINYLLLISTIERASSSIHMTSSCFIPGDPLMRALSKAARRGVDVKLIVPGAANRLSVYAGRHRYADLLKAGIKIYERRTGILQAKTVVIDREWATLGYPEPDYSGIGQSGELNAVVLSSEFASESEDLFQAALAASTQVHPEQWEMRPLFSRVLEWVGYFLKRWA